MWSAIAAVGGAIQSDAAKDAANIQATSADAATAEQRRQYDLTRRDSAPYRDTGSAAVYRIRDLLGLGTPPATGANAAEIEHWRRLTSSIEQQIADNTDSRGVYDPVFDVALNEGRQNLQRLGADPNVGVGGLSTVSPEEYGSLNRKFTVADFMNDPVNQLSFDHGQKAIERNLGALGMRKSGLMLKGLQDYAGTRAAESSSRFYGDQDRIYNRLAGVAGTGQSSTNSVANAGMNSANNIGNIMTSAGNARGAASIARGNAFAGGLNTVGNWWNQQNTLDRILGSRGQSNADLASMYNF